MIQRQTALPMTNISNEDFWKIFGPLLELSSNKTIDTFE